MNGGSASSEYRDVFNPTKAIIYGNVRSNDDHMRIQAISQLISRSKAFIRGSLQVSDCFAV